LASTKIVSITESLIEKEGVRLTPEEHIVYCARVSNPSNQLNTMTSAGLLKYCIKHKHWSVFQQVDFTVEIKTSRAIAAQVLRHASADFQEFSQRYARVTEFEPIELRKQGKTNRQVGDEVFDPIIGRSLGSHTDIFASDKIYDLLKRSENLYDELIGAGVAKECARMILPLCTQTTMYMKNNIRNWIHYIELRTKEDTQKEHRDIAEGIKTIFVERFPIVAEALEW
jgi:thymidylate synthase (FAD)